MAPESSRHWSLDPSSAVESTPQSGTIRSSEPKQVTVSMYYSILAPLIASIPNTGSQCLPAQFQTSTGISDPKSFPEVVLLNTTIGRDLSRPVGILVVSSKQLQQGAVAQDNLWDGWMRIYLSKNININSAEDERVLHGSYAESGRLSVLRYMHNKRTIVASVRSIEWDDFILTIQISFPWMLITPKWG